MMTVFRRPGRPNIPDPLSLRVNYGDDRVESFYAGDHTAWIAVTESDGTTVKATAEVVIEPKGFWDGETGFQTNPEDWDPGPPDIQPYDWVYGWVDNGASGQVQIGEIHGVIDLDADSVSGTVLADWFDEELFIICDPWGLSDPTAYRESSVYPDGIDQYECSWFPDLDILPGQELGVWYYGLDGHAVVNVFSRPNPEIRAWLGNPRVEGYGWPPDEWITLDIHDPSSGAHFSSAAQVQGTEWGTFVGFSTEGWDLKPGQEITMAGGGLEKTHTILPVSITSADAINDYVEGNATPGGKVLLCIYDGGCDPPANLEADGSGHWSVSYAGELNLRPGGGMDATEFDEDSDGTSYDYWIPDSRMIAFPAVEQVFGFGWPVGSEVLLTVNGLEGFTQTAVVGPSPWDESNIVAYFDFVDLYDLVAGHVVTLSGNGIVNSHVVRNLTVDEVDPEANTVAGTADDGETLHVYLFQYPDKVLRVIAESGTWTADFEDIGIDLVADDCGRVDIWDEDGSATTVDWCVSSGPEVGLWDAAGGRLLVGLGSRAGRL